MRIGRRTGVILLCLVLMLTLLPVTALAASSSVHISNDGSKTMCQNEKVAQSFTPTKNGKIDAFDVKLRQYAYYGDFDVKIELWSTDSNGLPSTKLATSGQREVSWDQSLNSWIKFTFSSPYTVTAGTKYAMVVVAHDSYNELMEIKYADTDTYSGGCLIEKGMGWCNKTTKDLAFRCWLTPTEYTVTFLPGDHGEFDPAGAAAVQTVEYGGTATAPTVDPEDYYEHTGWSGAFDNVTGNLEITAQYALVKHTVTFLPGDHGTFDPAGADAVQLVEHGSAATAPTVNADDNYEFTGWSGTFDNVTGDLEITAQYALVKHAVTFLTGDHGAFDPAGAAAAQQVEHGSGATAPTVIPDEGYVHTGWSADFSSITEPLTVTAQYEICEYTVTFESNGGNLVPDAVVEYNALVPEPDDPEWDYHTFNGWYQDEDLTDKWDFAADKMGSADMTLYASWTSDPITNLASEYTMYTGARVTWSPKPPNGTWTWDEDYLSASFDSGAATLNAVASSTATFKALKEGVTYVVYKANGLTHTVKVTILKPEVPVTGQNDTLFNVLAGLCGAALAAGLLLMLKVRHASSKSRE